MCRYLVKEPLNAVKEKTDYRQEKPIHHSCPAADSRPISKDLRYGCKRPTDITLLTLLTPLFILVEHPLKKITTFPEISTAKRADREMKPEMQSI
jgi:hypothetical protein